MGKKKHKKKPKAVHPLLWFAKAMMRKSRSYLPNSNKSRELVHKSKHAKGYYVKYHKNKKKMAAWKKRVLSRDSGKESGWLPVSRPKEEAVEFIEEEATAACWSCWLQN